MTTQNPEGPLTHAEKFAAARARNAVAKTQLAQFANSLDFELDEFQITACQALEGGTGVLLAAPTGAGKTILGEFAVHLAMASGQRAFYTTPIKALSNQKFAELSARYGADQVGLLTGDSSVNSNAPIVVMTTEVLRNMLYAESSALDSLGYVVMDEVHYLADRFRGAVWEEVIIHLPQRVRLVSLSATVSNAEEFGAWLEAVRGETSVIVSEKRPVPLWQHALIGRSIIDLFDESSLPADAIVDDSDPSGREVNPELLKAVRPSSAGRRPGRVRGGRTVPRRTRENSRPNDDAHRAARGGVSADVRGPMRRADRPAVVNTLNAHGYLPAIYFIFSRAACDAAVQQCAAANIWLTTENERKLIASRVDGACQDIPAEDLDVLGFWAWRDGLIRGIASHHAGLLPAFKELVEQLFLEGLVRVVFATETLALGINMPARAVVLEKLDKFNGEARVAITPGEYTQLTGRAGRRGIDVEGHAIVLWQDGMDPPAVAGLASRRTYPLNSSFRPGYNMSINLLAQFGDARSREILESSFAQFQADRSVVHLAREVRSREESLTGYAEAMHCHLGDFSQYAALRHSLSELEKKAAKQGRKRARQWTVNSLSKLLPGDVLMVDSARLEGPVVVVDPDSYAMEPRPHVLTNDHQLRRLSQADIEGPVVPLFHIKLRKGFNVKAPKDRRAIASAMRHEIHSRGIDVRSAAKKANSRAYLNAPGSADVEREIVELRKQLTAHPCHGCHEREEHARWGERWNKLRAETDVLLGRIKGRTNTIARSYERICQLLEEFDYLDAGVPTVQGRQLRRIYGDRDLLVAQALAEGAFNDVDAVEAASLASVLVYQARRDGVPLPQRMPSISLESAVETVVAQWERLHEAEERHHLDATAEPELGLVWPVYKWAKGRSLPEVLRGTDLAAGDFVRWIRQVIDLLGQLAVVPELDPRIRRICKEAIALLQRGVVAYSTLGD